MRSLPYTSGAPNSSRSTGMMPLPSLPVDSAINCSSHAPRSEIPGEAMRVILSRPSFAAVPDQAEHHSRILAYGSGRFAGRHHFFRALQKLAGVDAHRGGGNHAEVRERRIASADGWQAIENVAEAIALGDQLHLRTRIGDRDEVAARLVGAHGLPYAFEEVLLVDVGLQRAAGLAGNDEKRFRQVDPFFDAPDLRRVGGVEYVQAREAWRLSEGQREHFRTKA